MPIKPDELAAAQALREDSRLETAMRITITLMLEKLGANEVTISQADIKDAAKRPLVTLHDGPDDALIYRLPT